MQTRDHEVHGKATLAIGGAILAGLGASACCTIPLVAVLMGLGGSWMSTLSALKSFRPLFIIAAGACLGYGFWKAYRKPKTAAAECCEHDHACAVVSPAHRRFNLVVLWLGALFTALLIASPYLIPLLAK
jgi:mercuric ion transport protein